MSHTELLPRDAAREKLLRGATALAEAVRVTLGPRSKCVRSESNERLKAETGTRGFDARAGRFVDLVEAGILDPIQGVRLAQENAVSVAGTLLLTEATLTEREDAAPARHRTGEEPFD